MSLLSMPFLILNLGGEMIYILEQRLHAQNIPKEKSAKVMQDVTRALFSSKFVAELLKPQDIYSAAATREIFDRLAHSSIMRLSESSMDKLYDLMAMGLKYQMVACTHPRELVEVTLNHMDSIKNSIDSSGLTVEQVDSTLGLITKMCTELSSAEFAQIRQSLTSFFQDKKIKVSLFLQDGLQNPNGSMVLPSGGPLVNDQTVEAPGSIKYFDDAGTPFTSGQFAYPLAASVEPRAQGDAFDATTRTSRLGKNLYTVDRSKKKEAPKSAPPANSSGSTTTSSQKLKEIPSGQAELKLLKDMIGTQSSDSGFKITLFPDSGEPSTEPSNREISISKITREEMEKTNQELLGVIESMNIAEDGGMEKDMLELMDQATV
eukprot:NODE_2147_length_1267_cov_117.563158_g2041_i0.p1 GENE.NODE_2147_length_1267_cov_117.563158_g2041_i0~~NODE_2147_length_1267_cov_117.563158_g2041_i0.p1  ORF type:complete len:376 (-),score=106.31 NODE_2147_length_1267_cov_117.563158_g2041_i0:82-1209(-)